VRRSGPDRFVVEPVSGVGLQRRCDELRIGIERLSINVV